MPDFPYADRFPVNRAFPEKGRPREDVLGELRTMATEEDAFWETGKCSGTMYSGDHENYRFLDEAFGMFAHVNVLQRDMCPSATKLEGEILAMALDLMHADAVTDGTPAGLVTTGGTGGILHALHAYREHARQHRGITQPNFVKPETGHPAFDKSCHLMGIELRVAPVVPETTQADVAEVAKLIDDNTIAIMGSATNYGYGTIDPIAELGRLALERGTGMHVDACLGGFILPFGEELGYDIPPFDFRVPGVTSISADTHKYGYAFKGSSTALFRDKAYRNAQYFFQTGWSGGKYMSPGSRAPAPAGSWRRRGCHGAAGYREYAEQIFATSEAMQEGVRSHPELRLMGQPTFCFSMTSDEFDIYHVWDHMAAVIYDSGTVSFGGLSGELVVPLLETKDEHGRKVEVPVAQFARTPLLAGFRSEWLKFMVGVLHVRWGDGKEAPEQELRLLAEQLTRRDDSTDWARDLILLGDFNIGSPKDTVWRALTDLGWTIPPDFATEIEGSNIAQDKYYDQIALKPREHWFELSVPGSDRSAAGVFDYYDVVYRPMDFECYVPHMQAHNPEAKRSTFAFDSKGKPRSEASQRRWYRDYWRSHQMSDHLPLWVSLRSDYTDDYLSHELSRL